MTTTFLDNKICTFKIFYCRGVSHEKQRFWTIVLSAPKASPLKSENYIFIVVSPSLKQRKNITTMASERVPSHVEIPI